MKNKKTIKSFTYLHQLQNESTITIKGGFTATDDLWK